MILVDTSVWVDHLRKGNERLRELLHDEQVLCHPFVVGELACGNLRNRGEVLALFSALPQARLAEHEEMLHFIEVERLHGRGIGWVDVHLLASAMLTQSRLWTLDKALHQTARALKIVA